MERKYIFITGGVVSGLGKGTMAAALGRLFKARGFKVANQKFDPYINVDPGTMSPYRHGEVFVTEDGYECDLDIGHYERFTDENLTGDCNITSGRVYMSVIERERAGGYQGNDVQVIPHITDEIKSRIRSAAEANQAEVAIIEIGGTVGDIESLPFLEAIRQMAFEVPRGDAVFIHLTLVPFLHSSGEMKTKPTQHSVKELLSIGIQPDIIVCRTHLPISEAMRNKIALFCNVRRECVVQNVDTDNRYEIPLLLENEGLAELARVKLGLPFARPDLDEWRALCAKQTEANRQVTIALVGKYVELHDAYLSVTEALGHAAAANGAKLTVKWVDAESLEAPDGLDALAEADGIIIPGGFGERGVGGMILAANYARENKVPFFGICLGMQCAVIGFARSAMGLTNAYTTEFGLTPDPVIDLMPEQRDAKSFGGTIRRGASLCDFVDGSLIRSAYAAPSASERHRHRYEINNAYRDALAEAGLTISATSCDGARIEAVELPTDVHPWFLGVQYHPEFKSRPNRPHPLFVEFVKNSIKI